MIPTPLDASTYFQGTLILERKGKEILVLAHQKTEISDEPRQKEPRELFAIWKKSADAGGKIPGRSIGQLAGAVKTYVRENPNYHSSHKLPLLLPRFDSSKDWEPSTPCSREARAHQIFTRSSDPRNNSSPRFTLNAS